MTKSKGIGRGGRRSKAGRPPGAKSVRTNAIAIGAAKAGVTPLEYMLAVMRNPKAPVERRDDMAKAAAPFMHARISPVPYNPDEGPKEPGGPKFSDLEIARRIAYMLYLGGKELAKIEQTPQQPAIEAKA